MKYGWLVFWGCTLACVLTFEWAMRSANGEVAGYIALALAFVAINRGSQAVHDHRVDRDQAIRERCKMQFRTGVRR